MESQAHWMAALKVGLGKGGSINYLGKFCIDIG